MVKTNPQTPRKCLSVAEKIRFGIPVSHQTEPKLRYLVNSVWFGRTFLQKLIAENNYFNTADFVDIISLFGYFV